MNKTARLLTCNTPSPITGRIYPKDVMEKAVEDYQATIDDGRAFGELDNPNSPPISLDHISHRITKMFFEDDILYVDLEMLDTPAGQDLSRLLEVGAARLTPVMTGHVSDDGIVKDITIEKTNFIPGEPNVEEKQ